MKKMMLLLIFGLLTFNMLMAQCGTNKYEFITSVEEKGIYLNDKVLKSKKNKVITFILNENTTYGFFILNPSHSLPKLTIIDGAGNKAAVEEIYNEAKNYRGYIYTVPKSGIYKLKADFGEDEIACALLVLFFMKR